MSSRQRIALAIAAVIAVVAVIVRGAAVAIRTQSRPPTRTPSATKEQIGKLNVEPK